MLKAEHIFKSFGPQSVLRDLNLEIADGSIYGLVGVNGAGKSTLLRIIAGVYQADKGTVTLNGEDTFRNKQIRRDIAFVSDDPYFEPGSTISSMKFLYETMYEFDHELFQKYLDEFELDSSKPIAGFSKGMKRRTAILFAVCTHPKLLLLDEAYDGLEPLARMKFRRILAGMVDECGTTVIISSHSLLELEDICDSFGILEDGAIISSGDLQESRENVNKYQAAFKEEMKKEDFAGLDIMRFKAEGRVVQMVIKGNREDVTETLNGYQPLLLDVLPVTFEELFIYEMESRGVWS